MRKVGDLLPCKQIPGKRESSANTGCYYTDRITEKNDDVVVASLDSLWHCDVDMSGANGELARQWVVCMSEYMSESKRK